MKYLLDTNACITYINGRSETLRRRLIATPLQNIVVCSVTKAELFTGSMKSHNSARTRADQEMFLAPYTSLPFDDAAADLYGSIRANLERQGTPIGPNDILIAAIALANNLILVTHNTREFSRVTGLQLEDWQMPATP